MEERMFVWPPPADISGLFAGVVLERLKSGSTHIGFLYRSENSAAYVIHLLGHRNLKHELPHGGQLCVLCKIEAVRLPALAAFARRLYQKNKSKGIPYAFSSPEQDWFSTEGGLLLGPGRLGLTCGNFVLALFRAAGFPLVQMETWPVRAEDSAWQQSFLDEWGQAVAGAKQRTHDHLAQVRSEIGTVRCRPSEIGGAVLASEFPCDFDTAVRLALAVDGALPGTPGSTPPPCPA